MPALRNASWGRDRPGRLDRRPGRRAMRKCGCPQPDRPDPRSPQLRQRLLLRVARNRPLRAPLGDGMIGAAAAERTSDMSAAGHRGAHAPVAQACRCRGGASLLRPAVDFVGTTQPAPVLWRDLGFCGAHDSEHCDAVLSIRPGIPEIPRARHGTPSAAVVQRPERGPAGGRLSERQTGAGVEAARVQQCAPLADESRESRLCRSLRPRPDRGGKSTGVLGEMTVIGGPAGTETLARSLR